MKFIHLSDLHLGKRLKEFSMLEEQEYILERTAEIISEEKVQAVIIAGDIYDKPVPPSEAVKLFDDFLVKLAKLNIAVFAISGNHDSPERIAFGSRIMDASGIHFSPVYNGVSEPIKIKDEYGSVNFYMLPFVKPAVVRSFFSDEEIESYDDAVRTAVRKMNIDINERNVIIAHQFVTGAVRCDSESVSVGGLDDISADIFEGFDYAALGHIHGAQHIKSEKIRYCGTPLKYSFSEAGHKKSVTVIDLKEKGDTEIYTVPLVPKNDMREIKGTYMEVTDRSAYTEENRNDYIRVILTDEYDVPNAMDKLRAVYPNVMRLDYDNTRTRTVREIYTAKEEELRSPAELFESFYEQCNNAPMSEKQREYILKVIGEIWDE